MTEKRLSFVTRVTCMFNSKQLYEHITRIATDTSIFIRELLNSHGAIRVVILVACVAED